MKRIQFLKCLLLIIAGYLLSGCQSTGHISSHDPPSLSAQLETENQDLDDEKTYNQQNNLPEVVTHLAACSEFMSKTKDTLSQKLTTPDISHVKGDISLKSNRPMNDILQVKGNICIQAESIRNISYIKGHMVLTASQINHIENFKGDLFIHGAQVQKIEQGRGTIHLCDGAKILNILKFHGEVLQDCI